jgi:hypothetical protein
MKRYIVMHIFFIITNAWGDIYFLNPSATLGKNVLDSRLDISRFTTKNLFDTQGRKQPLPPGDSFNSSDIVLNFTFGLSEKFDFLLGIGGRENNAKYLGSSYQNTNLESSWIGIRYSLLKTDRFTSALEGLFRFSYYSNNNEIIKSQKLILGDSGTAETLLLRGGWKLIRPILLFGHLGINWPQNILSNEMIYQFKISFLAQPFKLDFGANGTLSFYGDPYPSLSEKRAALRFNTGGSNLFVSWNRESFIPFGEIDFATGPWNFGLNASMITNGKSTDNGHTWSLFLYYRVQ